MNYEMTLGEKSERRTMHEILHEIHENGNDRSRMMDDDNENHTVVGVHFQNEQTMMASEH